MSSKRGSVYHDGKDGGATFGIDGGSSVGKLYHDEGSKEHKDNFVERKKYSNIVRSHPFHMKRKTGFTEKGRFLN